MKFFHNKTEIYITFLQEEIKIIVFLKVYYLNSDHIYDQILIIIKN
jgi:hypothetical protein